MVTTCSLPPGLASTLPGLAVRFHLSRVRPVQDRGWVKLALKMITSCQDGGGDQYPALVVERSEAGSVGVVIMLERQGKFSTVNQRLLEEGCAVSSLFGSYAGIDEVRESKEVEEVEDVEDVVKDLDIVSSQVIKCRETAFSTVERLSGCVEADIRKMYL
jgi:hypothetical protein